MNGLGWHVQRRLATSWMWASVVMFAASAPSTAGAQPSQGEEVSPAALVAARELFRQATEDVDAGRFAPALEKFKKVADVKETPAVRFNIARCEESLGKTGAALADFELAEREARQDPKGEEVAKLAHDRAALLRPKVPRLTVAAGGTPTDGLTVSLDGGRLAPSTLGVPLPVDPGAHVVEATAPGRKPFREEVQLAAGDARQVAITMAASDGAEDTGAQPTGGGNGRRVLGYALVGGGVALAAGSIAFTLLHNGAVSDLTALCPNGRCPQSKQSQVQSTLDRARLDEGLAIGLGAGAVVVAGLGVYFLVTKPAPAATAPAAWIAPGAPGAATGASLVGRF